MSSPTSNAGNNFPGLQGPSSAKFKVAVRVRPLLPHEHATNVNVVSINNNTVTVVDPFDLKHQRAGRQMDVIHRSREQKFAFDHVFTTQGVNEIFSLTARDIVDDSANGYKGCVFAYGATGSGKTFTMLGKEGEVKGMNETCLEYLFQKFAQDYEHDFKITASFVEIYNEYIIDLLKPKNKDYLDLWDDPNLGTVIAGVKEIDITNISSMMKLLETANARRTTEATKANETSSRSHAILQLNIYKKPKSAGYEYEQKAGRLSII